MPVSPARALPSGTVSFLFTDIEGSTRLAQVIGASRYGEALERHRAVLRGAFDAAGGIEVGTSGDSFFVVFGSTSAAVAAAADGQRRLAATDWPDDVAIRVRMGVHTGDGILVDGTYVGNDVNRAARITAAGHGGQILLSEATSALVADSLPAGTALRSLGEHRLKDLRPERLCQLVIDGLAADFPPIRSLDARPNNLPNQLTTFVGRERELAETSALLEATRLLTLTGPGGTGKTRLSLQVAASAAERFPGGVYFVPLEAVRDPALLEARIAATLRLDAGARSIHDVLVERLVGAPVLLVLDNFEQVIGAAPTVAELLRDVPGLRVLVTSRAALRVSGEQEYPVPGLPAPDDPGALHGLQLAQLPAALRNLTPAALEPYEAVRLFVTRAIAVRPDFRLTNENAPAVGAICARLHGMPLAIELAAARIKVLSPEQILARLDHRLQLLASGSRDLPPRQQTLRGAIAWSYDILDPGQRRLFDRLSVFAGGCDLEAAEAVLGPAEEIGLDVFEGLTALADQSLVRAYERAGAARFRLLDTIREFAAEQLEARGERDEIRRRHAAVYLDLARRAAPELGGEDQRVWLDRLDREHDNVRAALDGAEERGDGETALDLAFAMWRFWQKRGHLPEARRRIEGLAARPWARDDPVRWARLNEALGGISWWQADLDRMREAYDEALRIWREQGDVREIANATYNASFAWIALADPARQPAAADPAQPSPASRVVVQHQGLELAEEARRLFEQIGDERGVANALWASGNFFYFQAAGDHGEAHYRQALELFHRVGDRTMEAWTLHMLGSGLLRTGRVDEARGHLRHALRDFHAAGDAAGVTLVLGDLSSVATAEGDLPRAARLIGASRSLTATTGADLARFVEDEVEAGHRPTASMMLSPEELEHFAAEGAAMSLDEAVAYALDVPVGSIAEPHPEAGA